MKTRCRRRKKLKNVTFFNHIREMNFFIFWSSLSLFFFEKLVLSHQYICSFSDERKEKENHGRIFMKEGKKKVLFFLWLINCCCCFFFCMRTCYTWKSMKFIRLLELFTSFYHYKHDDDKNEIDGKKFSPVWFTLLYS